MKKKKFVLSLPVILFALNTMGQGSERTFNRVLVGINLSHDYCSRTVVNRMESNDSFGGLEAEETGKPGFTIGYNVCINLNRRFGLQGGIQYSVKGYQTVTTGLVFGSGINPSTGTRTTTTMRDIYKFKYMDIPLIVNYTPGKNKFSFFASAGLTLNVLMGVTETRVFGNPVTSRDRSPVRSTKTYNRFNLSPVLSAGFDYQASDNVHLRVEPTFRYGLLKISDGPERSYLWNMGLNLSFYRGI